MLFNVMADTVIWHSVTVVAPMEAGMEVLGETIHVLEMLLYVDGRLVALPCQERFQRASNVLTDLFDWFGLCTNIRNTVIMACRTCYIPGGFQESSYTWQVTGFGPSYQEILQWRV